MPWPFYAWPFFVKRLARGRTWVCMGLAFILMAHYIAPAFFSTDVIYTYFLSPLLKLWQGLPLLIFFSLAFALGAWVNRRALEMAALLGLLSLLPTFKIVQWYWTHWNEEYEAISYPLGGDFQKVVFTKKPNFYFILLDSYTSVEGLKVLGMDQTPFLQQMKERDFRVYDSFFTNFQTTRNAMPTYLNMSLKNQGKIFYHVPLKTRSRIIAGEAEVYRVFDHNGYKVSILHPNRYMLGDAGCPFFLCSPPMNWDSYYLSFFRTIVMNNALGTISRPHL